MSRYVSQREFAEMVGKSHTWIGRLVRQGRLPVQPDKTIPVEEGLRAFEATKTPGYESNRARAERDGAERERKRAEKRGEVYEGPIKRGPGRPRKGEEPAQALKAVRKASIALAEESEKVDLDDPASVNEAFNRARTLEKIAQANLRKLEYQQMKGKLLPVDEVERETKAVVAVVYSKLLGVPARVAGRCEGRTSGEIEVIIRDELNVAMSDFQKWASGGGK